jgi:hypothetical protein
MHPYRSIAFFVTYTAESVDVKKNHNLARGSRQAERRGSQVRIVMNCLNSYLAGGNDN